MRYSMIFICNEVPYKVEFRYGQELYVGGKKKYQHLFQRTVEVHIEGLGRRLSSVAYCSPEDTFNNKEQTEKKEFYATLCDRSLRLIPESYTFNISCL